MLKSYVAELSRVYDAIFKDLTYAYPDLEAEFDKDRARLSMAVGNRGIFVFLEDLPNLGKHLDRCLSNGEYKLSGLPLSKRYSNRVVIPKFLRGLYLLVFDNQGRLKEEPDVQAIFFLRQVLYLAKKATVPCPDNKIRDEISNFIDLDASLPEPEGFWKSSTASRTEIDEAYHGFRNSSYYLARAEAVARDRDSRDHSPSGYAFGYCDRKLSQESGGTTSSTRKSAIRRSILGPVLLSYLDSVSRLLMNTLGSYCWQESSFKHGPGAVSDRRRYTNKYCWQLWPDRLEREYPVADCGFHNYSAWAAHQLTNSDTPAEEPMSRLVAVPKSYSKPRLIAAEPSPHMWCQQNLWQFMKRRVQTSWINDFIRFTDQSLNQRLCTQGSSDGSLATIDLSAASDRVTCKAVGEFFRRNPKVLLSLQSSRTRFISQKICPDLPGVVELRKFSTMGNACTFPVESLIFLGTAISCTLIARGLAPNMENILSLAGSVSVFGDDIIIPSDVRELLCDALEVLDFKVNDTKSFWTGRFRESCGVDAYEGVNVTPAYWQAPYFGTPQSYVSTLSTSNNFYSKFLVNTAARIQSTIRRYRVPFVQYGCGFLGAFTFVRPNHPTLYRSRWNKDLQRSEYYLSTPIGANKRTPHEDSSSLLQYFTEKPDAFHPWNAGVDSRPTLKIKGRWVPECDVTAQ